MFKTFLAALAAACLVAVILTSLGLAAIVGPAGIVLWAVGMVLLVLLLQHRRRLALAVLAIFGASVALSGCGTMGSGPSQLAPVIDSLAHAGCTGNLHFGIGAGSAAGLSPGSFHVENTFDGACDPRNATPAPQIVNLPNVGQVLPPAPPAPVTPK